MGWYFAIAFYLIGCVGLHATARDLNRGPIKDKRAWINLFLWPIMIPWAKAADLFDHINP